MARHSAMAKYQCHMLTITLTMMKIERKTVSLRLIKHYKSDWNDFFPRWYLSCTSSAE